MKMTKIKLTLKCLGLAFILPLAGAIILCAVGFAFAVAQSGFLSPGALISLACMLGFLAVLILPFALFYSKFYSRIDDIINLGDGVEVYVLSGGLLKNIGPGMVKDILIACVKRAHTAFKAVGYAVKQVEVKAPLNTLFIVFVSDIDELQYYRMWGIRYTKIWGLKMSRRIIVEKQYEEALDTTALDHEIFHVIVDPHDAKLRAIGRLADVEDLLGLEQNTF